MAARPKADDPDAAFVAELIRHQRRLYLFIGSLLPNPSDIEDVFQQTCLALWKKRQQALAADDFFAWACGFARNEALHALRSHRRSGQVCLPTDLVATLADEQFGGTGLVITATPDLGKISFAKGAHIVDLGWLGDPLFATIRADRPDLMDRYLLRVAVPDLVAAHSGWLCDYRGWIEDPAFLAEYELIGDPEADWRRGPDTCPADGGFPRWQRVIDNGEYELTRSLLTAGDPVGVVQEALEQCVERPGDSLRCQPVRRAAQRASQQLRDTGTFDDVVSAFAASPSAAFDEPMLRRGPAWWTTAAPAAIDLLEEFVS